MFALVRALWNGVGIRRRRNSRGSRGGSRPCRPRAGPGADGRGGSLLGPVVEQRNQLRVVPAWPAVSRSTTGRIRWSTRAWILVVNPPRDRPNAWSWAQATESCSSVSPPARAAAVQRSLRAPAACWWARTLVEWTDINISNSSDWSATGRNFPAQQGKPWRRCRPTTSGDAVSTPSARARTPPADPATAHPPGTARRSLRIIRWSDHRFPPSDIRGQHRLNHRPHLVGEHPRTRHTKDHRGPGLDNRETRPRRSSCSTNTSRQS